MLIPPRKAGRVAANKASGRVGCLANSPTRLRRFAQDPTLPLRGRDKTEIPCSKSSRIPSQALFGQLLLGLINGSFYALLSLGLAVIFGMLNIINFTHGAQYMMGAFAAFLLLHYTGMNYWSALIVAPILVGIFGVIIERLFLQWLYKLDHLYGLLLTFGIALIIEGVFRNHYGSPGCPMRCRIRCAADRISASCSCRTIAPG